MAGRKVRLPKGLWDKVKEVDETFANEVYTLSDVQLKEKVVDMSKYQTELEFAREKDQDLKSKQEQAKIAGETYTTPLKAIKLKRQLVFKVLKERTKS